MIGGNQGIELLPCPFCGCDAVEERDSDHHGEWFNLGCSSQTCHAYRLFYTAEIDELPIAVEWWNTRTANILLTTDFT